jgi:hypothetical protein
VNIFFSEQRNRKLRRKYISTLKLESFEGTEETHEKYQSW